MIIARAALTGQSTPSSRGRPSPPPPLARNRRPAKCESTAAVRRCPLPPPYSLVALAGYCPPVGVPVVVRYPPLLPPPEYQHGAPHSAIMHIYAARSCGSLVTASNVERWDTATINRQPSNCKGTGKSSKHQRRLTQDNIKLFKQKISLEERRSPFEVALKRRNTMATVNASDNFTMHRSYSATNRRIPEGSMTVRSYGGPDMPHYQPPIAPVAASRAQLNNTVTGANMRNVTIPVPKRIEDLFNSLQKGYNACIVTQIEQSDSLKGKIEEMAADTAKRSEILLLEEQLRLTEENAQLFQGHAARLNKLYDLYSGQIHLRTPQPDFRMGKNGQSLSVGNQSAQVRAGMKQMSQHLNAIEAELQSLMGKLKIEMKGIVGFARLTAGDVFDVQVKHGTQKWKTRGKTLADRSQKWESTSFTLGCHAENTIDVKASEVKTFGKLRVLSEQTFDPCQFFSAQPQLITINLNATGSMKLQLIATWIPLMSSKPVSSTTSRSSKKQPLKSTDKTPSNKVVDIREPYQANPRNTLNMAYTGNVPVYFDGYVERSQFTAPKMDMTGSVGSSWLKSASTMNLAATPDADSSQLSPLLSQLRPYIERLNRTYPELSSLQSCLNSWESVLKRNRSSLAQLNGSFAKVFGGTKQTSIEELDDNVLMKHEQTSENDSGIDSLRQHTSPYNSKGRLDTGPSERRFKHIKEQRRKSIGAVVDADEAQSFEDDGRSTTGHRELDHCLRHHLTRCLQTLKLLATRFGPLEYKEQELVGRLDQETTTLEDLLHVSRSLPALPNISNILADLNAGVELQDVWLSASYPANAILIVPAHLLKHEIRSCFGRIVSDRYPDLLDSVMDGLMNLMTDGKLWCPEWITVYQFVGAFRGKNLPPYIESLAHEAWIGAGLSSRVLPTVQMVMDRLLHVPVVPPMESLRHIGLVLMAPNRELHSVIERYLTKAQGQLAEDLIMTYICLLEHDDNESRQGACRALTILNSALAVRPLAFVARCDRSPLVREDARQALSGLVNDDGSDTFEMTKV